MAVKKFAAVLVIGALAILAVTLITDNAPDTVAEAVSKNQLPETMDDFVEVSVTARSSYDAFSTYQVAKEKAQKKAPSKFEAAKKQCSLLRTRSYKECGKTYCETQEVCGRPCPKLYGQPAWQEVPLTQGSGSRFYPVHEVSVKEVGAKEKKAKEVHVKELTAKERAKKEAAYKQKVVEEKGAKKKAHEEHTAKEKAGKELRAKERKSKESVEKKQEKVHKAAVLLKCDNKGDAVEFQCVADKAVEAQEKAEAAAATEKTSKEKEQKIEAVVAVGSAAIAQKAKNLANATGEESYASAAYASAAEHHQEAVALTEQWNHTAADAKVNDDEFEAALDAFEHGGGSGSGGVPTFSDGVEAEIKVAYAYAEEVIPPGGQRRLLAATGSAEDFGAEEAHTKEEIEALNATLVHDHQELVADQEKAAADVNATGEANIALTNAEDAFKTAHANEQDNDNNARLHASHAALVESKVKATDSYVGTHRGALHQTSCAEEKKFAFDVCFGRNAYKGQLLQTGKAKESRAKADKYKALMGKDYAIVLKSNATLISDEEAEHAAELLVQNMTAKLNEDGDALAKAETEYKSEVAEQKAAQAKAAAAAEEAAAAAAAQGGAAAAEEEASADADANEAVAEAAPTGSAAVPTSMYEAESALYAQLIEEEPKYTHESEDQFIDTETIVPETANRKLLTTDPRHGPDVEGKCLESTNAAFDTCEKDVDNAYAACTKIYNGIARL
jgi:hypothetical protein